MASSDEELLQPQARPARWAFTARRGAALAACAFAGTAAFLFAGRHGGSAPSTPVQRDATALADEVSQLFTPPVPADLCSDGSSFALTADISVGASKKGFSETIFSNDYITLELVDWNLIFIVKLDNGEISLNATALVEGDMYYSVAIAKKAHDICLVVKDKDAEVADVCTPLPSWIPIAAFQTPPVQNFKWGPGKKVKVNSFTQTQGAVSMSMAVSGISLAKFWDSDAEWKTVKSNIMDAVAAVSDDVMPWDVKVAPISSFGEKATVFAATILTEGAGKACAIQKQLQEKILGKKGAADSMLSGSINAAFKEGKTAAATGTLSIAMASVPAQEYKCSAVQCRKGALSAVDADATCNGASCEAKCCQTASKAAPLPMVPEDEVDTEPFTSEGPGVVTTDPEAPLATPPQVSIPDFAKIAAQKFAELVAKPKPRPAVAPYTMPADAVTGMFKAKIDMNDPEDAIMRFREDIQFSCIGDDKYYIDLETISVAIIQKTAKTSPEPSKQLTIPALSDEEEEAASVDKAKRESLAKDEPYYGEVDDEVREQVEQLAMLGKPEAVRRLLETDAEVPAEDRELFNPFHLTPVDVHFVIAGCVDECADRVASMLDANSIRDEERIRGWPMEVHAYKSPGEPITCGQYTCMNSFLDKADPALGCFGTDCEDICCLPRSCSDFECTGIRPIFANMGKTCTSPEDCSDVCCHVLCSEYECPEHECVDPDFADEFVKPCQARSTCCKPKNCCCSDTAWCKSCMECQTQADWCEEQMAMKGWKALIAKWGQKGRALEDDLVPVEEQAQKPTENLSAYKLPPLGVGTPAFKEHGEDMTAEELEKEVFEQNHLKLRGSTSADNAKERLRKLKFLEGRSLLAGGQDSLAKAAVELRELGVSIANFGSDKKGSSGVSWMMKKIMKSKSAKAACQKTPKGCTSVSVGSCSYYFESLFCLHRGHARRPVPVNAVQVLQDTVHAVSCGGAGECWVWKICGAKPRSLFIPKDSWGPVKAVSVLFDSLHILSAGVGTLFGGVAHVWEWRSGHEVATTRCLTGPYLSATEIPELHTVLLGCADGYVGKWNWHTGVNEQLPYLPRPVGAVIKLGIKLAVSCKERSMMGMGKLFEGMKELNLQTFLDHTVAKMPGVDMNWKCVHSIKDFFFGSAMGKVKAIAYVPTNVRFVTGSSDGRVRYWNSRTGTLLRVMGFHRGPVNAVVGNLVKQEAISGGDDGTIRVWCLEKGIQKFLFIQDYAGPVLSLAIYPAARIVVAGSADGYVRFWDLHSGMLLCAINTGGGAVNSVAINPSGPLGQILAAGADGYVRVFNPR